jgi:hypothetical protein
MPVDRQTLEEFRSYAERREQRAANLRKAALAFSSTITLAVVAFLSQDNRGARVLDDASFLLEATRLELTYSGPIDIVAYQGKSFEGYSGWDSTTEQTLTAEELAVFHFVEEHIGPPAPWTNNSVVLMMNAESRKNSMVNEAAGYGSFASLFPHIHILFFIDKTATSDPGTMAHELRHVWTADDADVLPNSYTEGMAELMRLQYEREYALRDPLKTGDLGIDPTSYDAVNKPDLIHISFYHGSVQDMDKAYFMAGQAWYRWYLLHPDFFKQEAQKEADFYAKHGRRPTYSETKALMIEVESSFQGYIAKNYILQNEETSLIVN